MNQKIACKLANRLHEMQLMKQLQSNKFQKYQNLNLATKPNK